MTQIQSFKRLIRRCAGLQTRLDLKKAAGQGTSKLVLCAHRLSAGWYMMEVTPDESSIGCLFALTTFADTECHEQTGYQCIQPANSGISKRLIWLATKSRAVTLSTNSTIDIAKHIQFDLIRLSEAFARSRLRRALPCINPTEDHSQNELLALYQRYSSQYPVPDVATAYQQLYLHAPVSSLNSVSSDIAMSELSEKFQIVHTSSTHSLPDKKAAPLLALVTGDISANVDLQEILHSIVADNESSNSSVKLWYCDHDHYTSTGQRVLPCLKPQWNKGLLHHGNYIGNLVFCTSELFADLGGLNLQMKDSALYDFLLRALDGVTENSVKRIAGIGYTQPSEIYKSPHGFFIGSKDAQAIQEYQNRHSSLNMTARSGIFPDMWNVGYALGTTLPRVEILIPTRDQLELMDQCISSILSITDYPNYAITVIDNNSQETSTHMFHERMSSNPRYRKLDYPGAFNYSAINNYAACKSDADILILLNNDTEVLQANWMTRIVEEVSVPDVGCTGVRLQYPNGLLQHAGVVTGLQGVAGHINRFASPSDTGYAASIVLSPDVSAVTGACLGIRRAVFTELGGMNEKDLKVAFNDVDLCLRARNAGYRNRYLGDVALIHHESVSRGRDNDRQKRARFLGEIRYMQRTHAAWIDDDPAWHPGFNRRFTTPVLNNSVATASSSALVETSHVVCQYKSVA